MQDIEGEWTGSRWWSRSQLYLQREASRSI